MAKPTRTCAVCGQPAAETEKNQDGTYLHTGCSAAVAAQHGWDQLSNAHSAWHRSLATPPPDKQ